MWPNNIVVDDWCAVGRRAVKMEEGGVGRRRRRRGLFPVSKRCDGRGKLKSNNYCEMTTCFNCYLYVDSSLLRALISDLLHDMHIIL